MTATRTMTHFRLHCHKYLIRVPDAGFSLAHRLFEDEPGAIRGYVVGTSKPRMVTCRALQRFFSLRSPGDFSESVFALYLHGILKGQPVSVIPTINETALISKRFEQFSVSMWNVSGNWLARPSETPRLVAAFEHFKRTAPFLVGDSITLPSLQELNEQLQGREFEKDDVIGVVGKDFFGSLLIHQSCAGTYDGELLIASRDGPLQRPPTELCTGYSYNSQWIEMPLSIVKTWAKTISTD